MKKQIFLLISLFISVYYLQAQNHNIEIQTGFGFYKMKGYSDNLQNPSTYFNFSYATKIVDKFPPMPFLKALLITNFRDSMGLAVTYSYNYTGGRRSRTDSLSSFSIDHKVAASSLGLQVFRNFDLYKQLVLRPFAEVGFILSESKWIETETVGTKLYDHTSKASAMGLFLEAGVKLAWKQNHVSYGILAYYHQGTSDYVVFNVTNSKVDHSSNWNGFRTGLSVEYSF